jgi:hypothetical protein
MLSSLLPHWDLFLEFLGLPTRIPEEYAYEYASNEITSNHTFSILTYLHFHLPISDYANCCILKVLLNNYRINNWINLQPKESTPYKFGVVNNTAWTGDAECQKISFQIISCNLLVKKPVVLLFLQQRTGSSTYLKQRNINFSNSSRKTLCLMVVRNATNSLETKSWWAFESNVSRSILSDDEMSQCLNCSFGPCVRITMFRIVDVLTSLCWNSTMTFLLSSTLRWSYRHILTSKNRASYI